MKSDTRIAIIGHFGGNERFHDGQTVKTLSLYDAMIRRKPKDIEIDKADTYYIKKNPAKFVVAFFRALFRNKKIVVLLSEKGRRFLFPILYCFAKGFGKEIYHYAIAGQLAEETKTKAHWRKYLNSFKGNWMEGRNLVRELKGLSVENAVYIPNFKSLKILKAEDLVYSRQEPFRFCTFSRVMPEKGIEDAVSAVSQINRQFGRKRVALDIYGPVEKGYEARFEQLLKENSDVQYRGIADRNESTDILKNYYVLLFPTHFKSEGIPGTILDAYFSGIPVIARWWPLCDELIEHGKTGYVYPRNQPDQLISTMITAIDNPGITNRMKTACLQKSAFFSEEAVMKRIGEEMKVNF